MTKARMTRVVANTSQAPNSSLVGPTADADLDTDLRWSSGLRSGSLLRADGIVDGRDSISKGDVNEMSEIS